MNVTSYFHKEKSLEFKPVLMLSKLISSEYLDIMKTRYLLLESIGRLAISRINTEFTLKEKATIDKIDLYFREASIACLKTVAVIPSSLTTSIGCFWQKHCIIDTEVMRVEARC